MSSHIQKVKNNLNSIIERMSENTEKFVKNPGKDFTRKRKLSFPETLKILITMGGNSLSSELLEHFDYSVETATCSAFIQQRSKINDSALPFLFRQFTSTAKKLNTYKGYRVLAADGSTLDIYPNPNDDETYFQNTPCRKGFNQLHLNAVYDLCNKIYTDAQIQPKRKMNETRALINMIDDSNYPKKTILVADRRYESYNIFAHIDQKGYKYAIRVKDLTSGNSMLQSLNLPKTGVFDIDDNLKLTRKQTNEVKANPELYKIIYPSNTFDYLESKSSAIYPMSFRVVRFEIESGKHECIITNLDKSEFTPTEIKELYRMRWGIETSFRELKYSIGLVNLHAKKAELVEQEIFARLITFNFCSMLVCAVAVKQKLTKYAYQANFTVAVQVCKLFFRSKVPPNNVEPLILKYILPVRKNRTYDRDLSPKPFVSFTYRVA